MGGLRHWQTWCCALLVVALGATGALGLHHAAASGAADHAGASLAPAPLVFSPNICGGPWQVVSSPNVANNSSTLSAVAALSSINVWAVGDAFSLSTATTTTLIEHWDGKSWTIVASPSPGNSLNTLLGLAAIGPNDVWAVGASQSQSTVQNTLTEHWNGSTWRVVPSPNSSAPNASANVLNAVAAVSSNNVWAVGSYFDSQAQRWNGLIEHWNGTSWSVVASPTPGLGSQLNAVVVVNSSDVWATGADSADSTGIAERWNGSSWALVNLPPFGDHLQYQLQGIVAWAANDLTTVGYGINGVFQPVALHWDGTSWTFNDPPALSEDSRFEGIATLPGTHQAFAVGDVTASSGEGLALIERWNGTSWVVESSPNVARATLWGVSADSPMDAWAVGTYRVNGYQVFTLVEHYTTLGCWRR